MRRLLEVQARALVRAELSRIATTDERKGMWRLMDGNLSVKEIAEKVKTTPRAVQYFMQDAAKADLIFMERRGYPHRIIDWMPPEWEEHAKTEVERPGDVNE
ncbi:MAG: hypothetical protein H3Z53_01220 [archaeon]|nr:hypothetical protein [archaeon]MCP8312983.1 hypothetical protein [archaeon]